MTTTTQVPAVTDWLVNAATVSASLGASTLAPVTIHDGPSLTNDTLVQPRHLYIGWDAMNGGTGADAVQSWPVLDRARTRDEDGTIVCTADAWSGSTVLKTQRDTCAAIVAAVELLLRGGGVGTDPGDASMGGLVLWSAVDGPFEWHPRQVPEGAGCTCVFRVTYRARLVTS